MVAQTTAERGTKRKREASTKLAKARAQRKKRYAVAREDAACVETKFRAKGGYGKSVVSPWDIPPGGISKSPGYKLLVSRWGGKTKKLPKPEERDGAPLSGGFPVHRWPPNVLVDVQRLQWIPDDWGQGIKNTGPGGTYLGWVSPEGKFYYHRSQMEKDLGRTLSGLDGFNAVVRKLQRTINPSGDKAFLRTLLSTSERKHLLKSEKFHFGIISARRASSLEGSRDIMHVEAQFRIAGVRPRWYVDAASLSDYQALGLDAVVGGKLTPARNMALQYASRQGKVCVQVSDDISKWEYYDMDRVITKGEQNFKKVNEAVRGARVFPITPVAAAQFMLAKMRANKAGPKLAGLYPTGNAAQALATEEFQYHHFILGDFFVADKSPCRFDEEMTLKEDYDFTACHLDRHGCVFRCNRLIMSVKHATNQGGAVSARDSQGAKERQNIAILQRKWPGVFYSNGRRADEVVMRWSGDKEVAKGGA
mmetsp:Transcript_48163/g.112657  ORF Transcript_48163/g.112657 Transcript_48163/m.112657 type:complete len:478 (+) Transcript_48163:70-1503(+)